MASESQHIMALRQRLWNGIKNIEEVYINGDLDHRVPGNLNVSFAYVEGDPLIMALKDLAVSSGLSLYLLPAWNLPTCCAPGSERRAGTQLHPFQHPVASPPKKSTTQSRSSATPSVVCARCPPLWEMFKDGVDLNTVEWASLLILAKLARVWCEQRN